MKFFYFHLPSDAPELKPEEYYKWRYEVRLPLQAVVSFKDGSQGCSNLTNAEVAEIARACHRVLKTSRHSLRNCVMRLDISMPINSMDQRVE